MTMAEVEPRVEPAAPEPAKRSTRPWTRWVDVAMRVVITVGGWAVILAFATIVVYIASVVVPLFQDAKVARQYTVALAAPPADSPVATQKAPPLAVQVDEYLAGVWVLDRSGLITTHHAPDGVWVAAVRVADRPIVSVSQHHGGLSMGFDDGTVRLGRVGQVTEWTKISDLPEAVRPEPGRSRAAVAAGGVAVRSEGDRVRIVRTVPDISDPLTIGPSPASAITLVDHFLAERAEGLLALRADGRLFYSSVTKRENMMTGETKRVTEDHEFPRPPARAGATPAALLLGSGGTLAYLVYSDGYVVRYNAADPEKAYVAEESALLPAGRTVAAVRLLLGEATLIVADNAGEVSGWFAAPVPGATARDNLAMVRAHTFTPQAAATGAIAISARDRQFVTASTDGTLHLRHMTSGTTQGVVALPGLGAPAAVAIAPKSNAIVAVGETGLLAMVSVDNPHPEGSLTQLFSRIHYEGYRAPDWVWQSSAGTDDAEPKLSLTPLVWGTAKATFYALLFGVPLAVMAAIYTSEFMHPRVRQVVKPTVELMASLPSVILGYIGAMEIAPRVEAGLMGVLLAFIGVPVGLMTFAMLWQAIPEEKAARVSSAARFVIMLVAVSICAVVAYMCGPMAERLIFGGDLRQWLSGARGSATPGWAIALTPLLWVGLGMAYNLYLRPRMERRFGGRSLTIAAGVELVRFAALGAAAMFVAWLIGTALSAAGWDLRTWLLGPYVRSNGMLVGILMGFAIIPIVYTVSEDALSRVPNSLRSASLGLGATRWQTAIRVVLPVAISGIFSACMIGLGRAVGETMIVLMASGRTPEMTVNPFSGLSALSANIATELPEAAVNSTHYRVLFFSAAILFVMTFVVNTAAEMIRMRYRKRAAHM